MYRRHVHHPRTSGVMKPLSLCRISTRSSLVSLKHPRDPGSPGTVGAAVVGAGVGAIGTLYTLKAKMPPQNSVESPLQGSVHEAKPLTAKSVPAAPHQHYNVHRVWGSKQA